MHRVVEAPAGMSYYANCRRRLCEQLFMAIAVVCPNSHRLACPDDRAGMKGQCPKCGTSFEIPASNGQSVSETDDDEETPDADEVEEPQDSDADGLADPSIPEGNIVFLCPNGHKLNGPGSLQGQPGQCPHCKAKFRIPVYDDESDEEELETPEEDDSLGESGDDDLLQLNITGDGSSIDAPITIDDLEELGDIGGSHLAPEDDGLLPDSGDYYGDAKNLEIHPLARLFATLWAERQHGGIVEIHLADHETILPDWWAETLSLESHGVFALQTADGSYVIETVAWDSIKRVSVRRITELPDGVFG